MPTETARRIGVAIAGCGKIARTRHAPEYQANPNAGLIGVYDENRERAEELAGQYGCKVYGSYEELLADKEVEAVSICTPNASHSAHTVLALEAGKDVLCEKPMASSVEEAQCMMDPSAERGAS